MLSRRLHRTINVRRSLQAGTRLLNTAPSDESLIPITLKEMAENSGDSEGVETTAASLRAMGQKRLTLEEKKKRRRALDAITTPIGEDVVAHTAHVAAPQIFVHGVELILLLHGDPHVHAVIAEGTGENLVELVAADLTEAFPADLGGLSGGLGAGGEGESEEEYNQEEATRAA
jgi:hypothetical protein